MKQKILSLFILLFIPFIAIATEPIRVASFDVDATPPLGSAMAYDPVKRLDELTLRYSVLTRATLRATIGLEFRAQIFQVSRGSLVAKM